MTHLNSALAERTYASSEVSQIAGTSLRQLQWWDERRVVSPQKDGHKREYRIEEVLEVSVIAELRRKGFSLQKIRQVLRVLRREMRKRLGDVLVEQTDLYLLTNGTSVYVEDHPGRVIDVLKKSHQPMFLVIVSEHLRRLVEGVRKPMRRAEPRPGRKARSA